MLGQRCRPAEAKNTYGTGCFVLLNTGERAVPSSRGLLTTMVPAGHELGSLPQAQPPAAQRGVSCTGTMHLPCAGDVSSPDAVEETGPGRGRMSRRTSWGRTRRPTMRWRARSPLRARA